MLPEIKNRLLVILPTPARRRRSNQSLPHAEGERRREELTCKRETYSVAPQWTTSEQVHWSVVNEIPDEFADHTVCTLISLGSFDDLFLNCAARAPDAHKPRVLDPIGSSHKASVIRSKGSGEHACAPWPMHIFNPQRIAKEVLFLVTIEQLVNFVDVRARNNTLFLTWVRNLWDRRNWPLVWFLTCFFNTSVVAIANRENTRISLFILRPHFT